MYISINRSSLECMKPNHCVKASYDVRYYRRPVSARPIAGFCSFQSPFLAFSSRGGRKITSQLISFACSYVDLTSILRTVQLCSATSDKSSLIAYSLNEGAGPRMSSFPASRCLQETISTLALRQLSCNIWQVIQWCWCLVELHV